MLLRMTRMRRVDIDPDARTARAEAGAVWADVTVPAGQHGQAVLAGSSPIKAAHDPDQVIISAHPVWPTRP
jgi:FAD/FMN-containing dehydrogenase